MLVRGRRETSGRTDYARELMRRMEVHSYGRVLRNRQLDTDRGVESKLETIASHRFTLAFENAIAEDYVTEKLYDPLVAGSVPVLPRRHERRASGALARLLHRRPRLRWPGCPRGAPDPPRR